MIDLSNNSGAVSSHASPALNGVYSADIYAGEAERLYVEARAIYERWHGHDHESVARGRGNLARVRHARGDLAGALEAQRQYLKARLTGIHVLHSAAGQAEDPDLRTHLGSLAEQHAAHVQAEWESLRTIQRLLKEAEAEPEVQQPHVSV